MQLVAAMVFEWGIIFDAMLIAHAFGAWWAYLLAILVVGTRQHALAVLGHDALHRHGGDLGVVLAPLVCFSPLGVGAVGYRDFHWKHHRCTGRAGDPELPVRRRQEARRQKMGQYPAALLDLVGGGIVDMWMVMRLFPRVGFLDVFLPLTVNLAFIALAPWDVIAVWYVAIWTSFAAAFRLRGYTEHEGRVTFQKNLPPLWQRAVFLPHGTWLHWEHHRWPGLSVASLFARHHQRT
jgi:fatty acid desaturase